MPFNKDNAVELGRKGGQVKKTGVQEYLEYLASGAARGYYERLEKQKNGKELTKPEREFMDRFERQTEYIAPKLSRTEQKTEHSGEVNFKWE